MQIKAVWFPTNFTHNLVVKNQCANIMLIVYLIKNWFNILNTGTTYSFEHSIWKWLSDMPSLTGKFDYSNAWNTTRLSGPLLFGFFTFCFNFVLVNIFISILLFSFEAVRQGIQTQSNEHEVVDYMMKKMKFLMGIGKPPNRKNRPNFNDPRMNMFKYIEGM